MPDACTDTVFPPSPNTPTKTAFDVASISKDNASSLVSTNHASHTTPAASKSMAPTSPPEEESLRRHVTYQDTGIQTLPPSNSAAFTALYGRAPKMDDIEHKMGLAALGRFGKPGSNPHDSVHGAPYQAQQEVAGTTYTDSSFQTMDLNARDYAIKKAKVKALGVVRKFKTVAEEGGFQIWHEVRDENTIHSEQHKVSIKLDDKGNAVEDEDLTGRYLPNIYREEVSLDQPLDILAEQVNATHLSVNTASSSITPASPEHHAEPPLPIPALEPADRPDPSDSEDEPETPEIDYFYDEYSGKFFDILPAFEASAESFLLFDSTKIGAEEDKAERQADEAEEKAARMAARDARFSDPRTQKRKARTENADDSEPDTDHRAKRARPESPRSRRLRPESPRGQRTLQSLPRREVDKSTRARREDDHQATHHSRRDRSRSRERSHAVSQAREQRPGRTSSRNRMKGSGNSDSRRQEEIRGSRHRSRSPSRRDSHDVYRDRTSSLRHNSERDPATWNKYLYDRRGRRIGKESVIPSTRAIKRTPEAIRQLPEGTDTSKVSPAETDTLNFLASNVASSETAIDRPSSSPGNEQKSHTAHAFEHSKNNTECSRDTPKSADSSTRQGPSVPAEHDSAPSRHAQNDRSADFKSRIPTKPTGSSMSATKSSEPTQNGARPPVRSSKIPTAQHTSASHPEKEAGLKIKGQSKTSAQKADTITSTQASAGRRTQDAPAAHAPQRASKRSIEDVETSASKEDVTPQKKAKKEDEPPKTASYGERKTIAPPADRPFRQTMGVYQPPSRRQPPPRGPRSQQR